MRHTLLLTGLILTLNSYGQYYESDKGTTMSDKGIPSQGSIEKHFIIDAVDWVTYTDTTFYFTAKLPEKAKLVRTGTTLLMTIELPAIDNVHDYISINCSDKDDFPSVDSLVYSRLLKHKNGDYLNGNKNGIFRSAERTDTLTDSLTAYRVQLDCGTKNCTHKWIFLETEYGYFIVLLAARNETYTARLETFDNFFENVDFKKKK